MKFERKGNMWGAWGECGLYYIDACDDGTFTAWHADLISRETTKADETFRTLQEAKGWCEAHEAKLEAERVVLS